MAINETIPVENFSYLDGAFFEKHVIAIEQSQKDLETFFTRNYPDASVVAHSLSREDGKPSFGKIIKRYQILIREIQPDIIHGHHALAGILGVIGRVIFGTPLIMTAHNSYWHYGWRQRWAFFCAFKASKMIVCNSHNTARSLPQSCWDKEIVIYNGVDFEKVAAHQEGSVGKKDRFCVGTAARLVPQKNLETLVEGFYLFNKQRKSRGRIELCIIGDGPERARLERLVEERGIGDLVTFTGGLPREEVYRKLGEMDIFVVCSLFEGFCNAMVEAAGSGTAVIATNIPPLPEVIGENNARFMPVGDSKILARYMEEMYEHPERRKALGEAGKEFVTKRYSLRSCADNYSALYNKLVDMNKDFTGNKGRLAE